MTSRHLKSRPDYWKCQVVGDLEKIVYVKIVEALRPADNVDGSYTFSNTTSFQSFLLKFGKNVVR